MTTSNINVGLLLIIYKVHVRKSPRTKYKSCYNFLIKNRQLLSWEHGKILFDNNINIIILVANWSQLFFSAHADLLTKHAYKLIVLSVQYFSLQLTLVE